MGGARGLGLMAASLLALALLSACNVVVVTPERAGAPATLPALPTVAPTAAQTGSPATGHTANNPGAGPAATPALAVATLTATPAPPATPGPSATPHPLAPYTLAGLRARTYNGGAIARRELLEETADYTRTFIAYPSDGLTITGVLQEPPGAGPFPVVILLHGYIDRDRYYPGSDTWREAEFFNRHGYLTLAPDFRTWGGSDQGESLFHTGLVIDTINLISSLPSLPTADPQRVLLWGHSMGGGVTTKVLVVDRRPRAAVLYAPNSADDADLIARWGPGCRPGVPQTVANACNPGESLPPWLPAATLDAYYAGAADPDFLRQVAPLYHLEQITAPVQIHIGDADGQQLVETPPEWAQKLYTGLLAADRQVEIYDYPGAGHTFTGAAWEAMMERALAFYEAALAREP